MAALNKAIPDGAPAQFLSMVRYKAPEAGIVYMRLPRGTSSRRNAVTRVGWSTKSGLMSDGISAPAGQAVTGMSMPL